MENELVEQKTIKMEETREQPSRLKALEGPCSVKLLGLVYL